MAGSSWFEPWMLAPLAPIGGAIAWLAGRSDVAAQRRQSWLDERDRDLAAREERLDKGQTTYTATLERRLAELERIEGNRAAMDEARDLQLQALRLAFELVSSALRSKDPDHPALTQAQSVLNTAFPIKVGTPSDLIGLLRIAETIPSGKAP